MSIYIDHKRIASFKLNLECLDTKGRVDAVVNEIMETGGTYTPPQPSTSSSHLYELQLHGIPAMGFSMEEAIRNWLKAAERIMRLNTPDPVIPFSNPRNHAEEIANARAAYDAEQQARQMLGGLLP